MWLTLARDAADPERHAEIIEAHRKAFEAASAQDREAAVVHLQRQVNNRR
jgi:hypothetical protein